MFLNTCELVLVELVFVSEKYDLVMVEMVLLIAVGDKSIPSLRHKLSSSLSRLSLCIYFCSSVSVL